MEDKHSVPATVGKYHPGVYDRLNGFRVARQLLADHYHRLPELGNVFVRHNVHERYGLRLLHKHFELFGDEYLMRTIEPRHGVAFVSPVPRRMYAVPYLWRAQRGPRGQWLYYPLEFAAYSETGERRAAEFEGQAAFLIDIAEHLERCGVLDVFGIVSTKAVAAPSYGSQVVVETVDSRRRVLTAQAEERAEVRFDGFTETFWSFRPSAGPTSAACEVIASAFAETTSIQIVAAPALGISGSSVGMTRGAVASIS